MGRERAFTAKVVMLRGKPTGQVGTIGIAGPGHWQLLCRRIGLRSNYPYGSREGKFMERLAVRSAVIGLMFLISWPSAFAAGQQGFSIKVVTSPDDQFWANSIIIEGVHEVMLVDAQLTKTGAEKVLQEIKETKKPLPIIYITHEHADHFLGLEVFREAYQRVRIIANSAVTDRVTKGDQGKYVNGRKN